ncbi:hypothetical protein HKD37_02G005058 [Glycine soja]
MLLLDIDYSYLPSFVHPTNQLSSNSTRLILGPTEAIQFTIGATPNSRIHNACPSSNPRFVDYTFDRAPLTIIIVKSFTPNDFGDIKVTLKDPTWTIDATMKRTIIEGQDCSPYMMDIHAIVFCSFPPHSKYYLNITMHNVVKVMYFHFRLPIILVLTNLHWIPICCSYLTQVFPKEN